MEDFSKRTDSKSAFTSQIFSLFTNQCGGSAEEFADTLYGKYTVEEYTFYDDYYYWCVHAYLKDKVIPHKIAVWQAGMEIKRAKWFGDLGIDKDQFERNLWSHDMSKFCADEFMGYAFYRFGEENGEKTKLNFERSWNHHKNHNPHHPEYWLNVSREGKVEPLPMPDIYVAEMIADWMGAGKTYGSTLEEWLPKNIGKCGIHRQLFLFKRYYIKWALKQCLLIQQMITF